MSERIEQSWLMVPEEDWDYLVSKIDPDWRDHFPDPEAALEFYDFRVGLTDSPVEEAVAEYISSPDYDPTPYCHICGASKAKHCNCGPYADNH